MIKVNYLHYTLLIKSLIENPATAYELSEEIGLSSRSCRELLALFKKHKIVHIAGWAQDKGGSLRLPVYAFGEGKDKYRIKTPAALRSKRYRDNKKLREMVVSTLPLARGSKPDPRPHQ